MSSRTMKTQVGFEWIQSELTQSLIAQCFFLTGLSQCFTSVSCLGNSSTDIVIGNTNYNNVLWQVSYQRSWVPVSSSVKWRSQHPHYRVVVRIKDKHCKGSGIEQVPNKHCFPFSPPHFHGRPGGRGTHQCPQSCDPTHAFNHLSVPNCQPQARLMYACLYTYNHSILAIKSAQTKLIEQWSK